MKSNEPWNYRAVLIGIDAYARKPLKGCVNDIDRIEAILIDKLGLPTERITRLAAPHRETIHSTRLPSIEPTRKNIREALEQLAEEAGAQDLVFVYYSGHASQVLTCLNGSLVARGALLPVDYLNPEGPSRSIYDFELNQIFSRIAQNSADITVILDCCHSANVAGGLSVASCRGGELSYEIQTERGIHQGAFTLALTSVLESSDSPLLELSWADIWDAVFNRLAKYNVRQNPSIVAPLGSKVFGGPRQPRDLGFAIQEEQGRFRIGAGNLADFGPGAEVAVYGKEPPLFPAFGSDEERSARIGTIRVEEAARNSAVAISINGNFLLPTGARARLFRSGEVDRLPVCLQPPATPELRTFLEEGSVLCVVDDPAQAEAIVHADGYDRYHLGDSLYGDGSDPECPMLFSFPSTSPVVLRRVLEHYADYNRVLRIPRRCTDLPGALSVELLDCTDLRGILDSDLQAPPIPALPFNSHKFQAREGEGFAFSICNRSEVLLYVTVLNCAGSGRIEFLGQAEVKPGALQTLWDANWLGVAFHPRIGTDRASIVDRLVIVGTTLPGPGLRLLAKDISFAEAFNNEYCDREAGIRSMPGNETPPLELWTATMVPLLIQR